MATTSTRNNGILSPIRGEDFEENVSLALAKVAILPIKIPLKTVKYSLMLPFLILTDIADTFIVGTLKKMDMTKSQAKEKAKEVAKLQALRLRSLCIFLLILITVFSLSFGFSTAAYTGLYWMMIPSNIV